MLLNRNDHTNQQKQDRQASWMLNIINLICLISILRHSYQYRILGVYSVRVGYNGS
jgi:hypothetical protein